MKRFFFFVVCLLAASTVLAEDNPKCHVYIDGSGIVSNVDAYIRVVYSSSNLCAGALRNYVCYSYFEDAAGCTKADATLIDLFKKDARRDDRLIE